jgi:hypothetical protein
MKWISVFYLLINLNLSFAQQLQYSLEIEEGSILYTDELQNLYVNTDNVIRKYLPDGLLQYEIAPKGYGQLTYMDVTDPLRPLLYYRDQGLMVVLDNTLSEQGRPIDLFRIDIGQPWFVSQSADNHYWIYDLDNFELLRLDRNMQVISRSGNLYQVCGQKVIPSWMLEKNSKLYVAYPEKGVYVFDLFGTLVEIFPLEGVQRFQVIGRELVIFNNNQIKRFLHPLVESTDTFKINEDVKLMLVGKDLQFLLKESRVDVYRM